MGELITEIQQHASFLLVSILIGVGTVLLAKLTERFLPSRRRASAARRVSIIGMCSAIAMVLYILDFPVPFLAPPFYKLDFSEIPVLLCGFFLGPSAGITCLGIKVLLKLVIQSTSTAFVGDLANFVIGCTLVLPATILYHKNKTQKSAIWGMILGTVVMTVFGSAFNAVYLLPKFSQLYELPLDAIVAMGTKINGSVDSVYSLVAICVAPLNLVKGAAVSVLTLLLYKHVEKALFRER